jgi:hypothetical protein
MRHTGEMIADLSRRAHEYRAEVLADPLEKYGMSVESIVGAVHRVMARKPARA